jgi:3-hydroxyisobutyrate dehydrogenase
MAATGEPVAILGVGTMGHGMAASALRAGLPTILWDRHPEATRDLADRSATVAETAAGAPPRAGTVATIVPDADAVISVARDQEMLAALAPSYPHQRAAATARASSRACNAAPGRPGSR